MTAAAVLALTVPLCVLLCTPRMLRVVGWWTV